MWSAVNWRSLWGEAGREVVVGDGDSGKGLNSVWPQNREVISIRCSTSPIDLVPCKLFSCSGSPQWEAAFLPFSLCLWLESLTRALGRGIYLLEI